MVSISGRGMPGYSPVRGDAGPGMTYAFMIKNMFGPRRTISWVGVGLISIVSATALFGCGRPEESIGDTESAVAASSAGSPVSFDPGLFAGILPCASCPGIETQIEFHHDHTYLRKQVYLNGSAAEDRTLFELGRWALYANGRLTLFGNDGAVTRFIVVTPEEIRILDQKGRPIESEANLSLHAEEGELGTFGPATLRGMYTYFADAAIFAPCNTDVKLPVSMTERHIDLEEAYLQNRSAPGAPLLVEIVARLEDVPAMEGDGMEEALVITEVRDIYPGESCLDQASLTDSVEWVLRELDGVPIEREDPAMLPSLTFGVDRITGSTGCNRLTGPFELSNGDFRLGPLAMTRRACPDTLESTFVQFIETVESHRVYGDWLELTSESGSVALFARQER